MAGTINSLGLGSGVLTADLLDKLKSADEATIITPIKNKITLNSQKSQALDLLNSLMTTFKSSVSALDDDTLYQKRSVSGNNDGVSVSAAAGTQIRDFTLEVTAIAKKNVLQSGSFSSPTSAIANGAGTLNFNIAGTDYTMDYTAATTLTDLKNLINDNAGSAASASILQTGTNAYSLVVTSKETGKTQTISMNDLSGNLKPGGALETAGVKSGSFLSKDDFIAGTGTSGDTIITVGGTAYNFAYDDTTTLQGLADQINAHSTLSNNVTASVVKYAANDYRLVLTPKSGVSSAITITDSAAGLDAALTSTTDTAGGVSVVQNARDASFKFDGITLTRSTNTITDIASGMTVTLLKDNSSANISITQNRDQIAAEVKGLVTSYNTLQKQLGEMIGFDKDAGKVGIFNGDNTIKNLGREITRLMTSFSNSGYSLPQYGIDLSKEGVMSFNETTFMEKMNADPEKTEAFFSGQTTVNSQGSSTYTAGVFSSLNDLVKNYTKVNGTLFNLTNEIDTNATKLAKEQTKAAQLLEARYSAMQAKFAAYDSLISKINSQFSALKQQIDAAANAKN